MFYIHQTACISPQSTFADIDIDTLNASVDNQLKVIEPPYKSVPPNMLRRMSKIARIGVGAAMPLINAGKPPEGIIIGTANGGMEESGKFLDQIINYQEGLLTPGDFVQSTPNATAALIGLLSNNHSYNVTHVHKGLAFENSVIDAAMLLKEHPLNRYLLGGIDGPSAYNYQVDFQEGWYKKEPVANLDLYGHNTPGTISGEGAALFIVSNQANNALAKLRGIAMLHHTHSGVVKQFLQDFIALHLQAGEQINLFISGENGDNRYLEFYQAAESLMGDGTTIARFKHLCGEYPTASSFALWLACQFTAKQLTLPKHMVKRPGTGSSYKNILIYNMHKSNQHSCMLVSAAN